MTTEPRSLLRFVQLRRLVDAATEDPGACTTGPEVVRPCFDFRDDWSPAVQDAVTSGNSQQVYALYRKRRGELGELGAEAAQIALALLRLATVDRLLTVGGLRDRLRRWAQGWESDEQARRALRDATTWAVDVVTLRRRLRPEWAFGASEPVRILRGMVLVRLASSDAQAACRVSRLLGDHVLRLPPIAAPRPDRDPLQTQAGHIAWLSRDLDRMRSRTHALARQTNPTLADLRAAAYPDLADAQQGLEAAAAQLGLPPTTTAAALLRVLDGEYAEVRRLQDAQTTARAVNGNLDLDGPVIAHDPRFPDGVVSVLHADARVLGRGDLMIVRTEHLRYDLGDISHVENVLASEVRERNHVVDTSTSDTVVEATQTLAETTQELETTEQSSLERATQLAASTDLSTSFGVSVSGGLGPVQAGLDFDVSSSTSTSTSSSSAVSYATSLTEKASETLRSEASYRRTTTTKTRVTETNLHRFDNGAGTANIAGVYRWLEKVDLAQVYNYGERLLLEFVVPEPAAQLVAMTQAAQTKDALDPPAEWTLDLGELTEDNYVEQAAHWDVLGLQSPPPPEVFVATTFVDPPARPYDHDKNSIEETLPERGYGAYAKEVVVPDGYAASVAQVTVTWGLIPGEIGWTDTQAVQLALGENKLNFSDTGDGMSTFPLSPVIAGPIPIGISSDQRGGLTMAVRIRCDRTDEAYEAWRLTTYEAIRGGYLAELNAYDTELRLQEARQAYVSATAPDANRLIEMQELKRGCQTILTGQDFDLYGAVTFQADDLPRIDRADASAQAESVQFFENCFEWENLTYLFYPYQWAGRARWSELLSRSSTDPLHQSFLQAGAARVVVPVRSGYEHAVGDYLATSIVPTLEPRSWRDGTNPYPPIEELIADALDRPGKEVPVGEPWELVTPTSLVYLQLGSELNPEPAMT